MSSDSEGKDKRKVRVTRRRRATSTGDRQRAEAPRRETREDRSQVSRPAGTGDSQRPPVSMFPTTGPSGGRRPSLLLIGLLVLALLCVVPLFLIFGGGSDDGASVPMLPEDVPEQPAEVVVRPTSTSPPVTFVAPSTSADGQTWLVMLYQDADDKILEQDIYVDLNEAERAGSSDQVHIVSQVDRYRGAYQADGNWHSTRRYYITHDNELGQVNSQLVEDLGEVNMADGDSLVDFVAWAVDTFPANKHVLILSDHGMGWPGGWSDQDPGGRDVLDIPLAARLGDELFLMELDQALGEIRSQTGIAQFEVIGLDACLMAHVEVFSALAPHARYAVASQETEPALGWAYTSFLTALQNNPDMDGAELSQLIVGSYIQDDQRIQDDQARAELLRQGSPMGGLFGFLGQSSAEQVARQMERNITLSAVDLSNLPALLERLNEFVYLLQDADQTHVAQARAHARTFTSIFGDKVPPSYIDLGNFAQLVRRLSGSSQVDQAADQLIDALGDAVIAERHGEGKSGSTGISVYFPNSQLYSSPVTGAESYTAIAERFSLTSLWDDFLTYHYTGRSFDDTAEELVLPEPDARVSSPGEGRIEASPIRLSSDVASPGNPVLLTTDISGENIGYIYLLVGYYDAGSNSIYVADRDYLESVETREIDGVYYPEWGEGDFTMEFEWEPLVFAISNGQNVVPALFKPHSYGESYEEAVYTVDGTYTFADDGDTRHARLYFIDGVLRQVFGFTAEGGTGAPREIIPRPGDAFTVQETWMELDQSERVVETITQNGGTLVFGDQPFTWLDLDAAPGVYMVGFAIEDLDGNSYEVYEQVTVE